MYVRVCAAVKLAVLLPPPPPTCAPPSSSSLWSWRREPLVLTNVKVTDSSGAVSPPETTSFDSAEMGEMGGGGARVVETEGVQIAMDWKGKLRVV